MKWKLKQPKIGDIRLLHKFLFLPIIINSELRWLEWAIIEQQYDFDVDSGNYWRHLSWIDYPIDKSNK